MQYFIVWSDDLPASVAWYLRRGGAWAPLIWLAMALKGGPAALLVAGSLRRNPATLRAIALAIAAGSVLEMAWIVLPAPGPAAGGLDVLLYLAVVAALGSASAGLGLVARSRRAAP
jgi:heme exporter protein D